GTLTDIDPLLRVIFSRIGQPQIGSPAMFSFNDTRGMCENCEGIGRSITLNLEKAVDFSKSLNEGAILLDGYKVDSWMVKLYTASGFFDSDKKIKDYTEEELEKFLYGKAEKFKNTGLDLNTTYMGLVERFEKSMKTDRERSDKSQKKIEKFTIEEKCKVCEGKRYNKTILSCKINGYSMADLTAMQVDELIKVIEKIENKEIAPVIDNLKKRLTDLVNIGLDYISLNRETSTLSGGESQRIKMVKNLSSALSDMIYIFDEPSIGLHPRDVHRLCNILEQLRDKGNTVIVVEHDPDVIKIGDYVVDMGPKAGSHGGEIVYAGEFEGLINAENSLTAKHLYKPLPINENPKPFTETFTTEPSNINNLKNTSITIPKGIFTVVTGVAGSGKSTLVHQVFAKKYPEAVIIDQSAVGANSRSNSATYTGIMDHIRAEFAEANNASASLFSFNSEGACEACNGAGVIEMDLSFMDAIKTTCEACHGTRFKAEVLELKLNGQSIDKVMSMTITEANEFFTKKEIKTKLKNMLMVGLGYLTLGQPLSTLSGGECQRLKLAKELNKKGNIYIMDEPTTGLHFSDIDVILDIIKTLVKKGNTVITIEHNLDIIRSADWIVDIGPGAGIFGGQVLYEGVPMGIRKCEESLTGKYI
ncbi:MAG: excinuclease ABC subunit UvrA, partial [Defluviitaleaceae bacterium]|nr:excinuclease ABC subunit UvrA [Defluviitaleaceae bacterium]